MVTKTGVKIRNVVIGDDFRIKRTYTGFEVGAVIVKAWLTVKKSARQADSDALIKLEITTSITGAGQITDADTTDGALAMFFDLPRAKTILAKLGLEYVYDIQVKTSDDRIHTLEAGTISFIRGVTEATT